MTIDRYDRTWEQNELLGLNDMKVENYGEEESNDDNKDQAGGSSDVTCATGKAQER